MLPMGPDGMGMPWGPAGPGGEGICNMADPQMETPTTTADSDEAASADSNSAPSGAAALGGAAPFGKRGGKGSRGGGNAQAAWQQGQWGPWMQQGPWVQPAGAMQQLYYVPVQGETDSPMYVGSQQPFFFPGS